jgi:uncharacterized protein
VSHSHAPSFAARLLARLEAFFFTHRKPVLVALAALTVVMGFLALQLRMDAGF